MTVTGLSTGDEVSWTTSGTHNRVLIENISNDDGITGNNNNTFDIGGFSIGASSADSAVVGSAVHFEDDGPTIAVEDSSGTYSTGTQGTWSNDPGSDGFNSLSLTLDSYSINGVAGTGSVTLTKTGDFTFSGSIVDDFTDDGIANAQTFEFTLTFNPDGTYDLVVTTPPTSTSTFDTSQGSLKAGGPDAVQTLLFGGSESGADDIVFFSVVPNASPNDILGLVVSGATDLTEEQIEASGSSALNAASQMNVSTSGIGVNNNNLNTGESFVVNPETVVDTVTVFIDNSVGGYNPSTEQLYYTIYYTDGTISAPILVTADMLEPVTSGVASGGVSFTIDGGDKRIDAVQLTMGTGTIKIPVIQFTVETVFNPQPISMNFTATITDNDGDSQQDTFSIDLTP